MALLLASAVACVSSGATSYTGRLAKPESRVALFAGDPRTLKWQTNDLIIDGLVAWEKNQLDLVGVVQLQSRLRNYPVVAFLNVNVHALDGDGVILGTYPLWRAGYANELFFINWSFERHLMVPDSTAALTFSYRGRMQDGGRRGPLGDLGGDGIDWEFWHTP
ncbi:MAG: hypothetical protein PVJ53_01975 [Desulfobacterales bacterium]